MNDNGPTLFDINPVRPFDGVRVYLSGTFSVPQSEIVMLVPLGNR